MIKKRLGLFGLPSTTNMCLETGERTNGSRKATSDFFTNIYRYGCFDEYHCFVQGEFEPYSLADQRFTVIPFSKLKKYLRRVNYTAFHQLSPTLKNRLVSERQNNSRNLFPITTTTHSISYSYMLSQIFAQYCFYPMYSFDAVLASSESVKKTLSYYFQQASIFCQNSFQSKALSYPGKIPVIPLGIDYEMLNLWKMPKIQAKAELGFPENSCVILWFGRISAGTKADLLPLVQSLSFLCRNGFNEEYILIIAGSGDDCSGKSLYSKRHRLLERYLKEKIPDVNIQFSYCPSDELKSKLFSAADIFVSLSDNIQESFGLTVIEAQAMGLPVIVSDWNGYKDTVVNEITGFKIPTYWCNDSYLSELAMYKKVECYHFRQAQSVAIDIQEFISRFMMLVKDKNLRKKMGKQASIHACQYKWSQIIKRYEHLWNELNTESKFLTSIHNINNLRISSKKNVNKLPKLHMKFNYYNAFSHFATHIVNGNWEVELGYIKELLIDATSGNLSPKIIFRILELIEKKTSRNKKIIIYDLVGEFDETDLSGHNLGTLDYKQEIIRHIMWLFKQGIINCCNKNYNEYGIKTKLT